MIWLNRNPVRFVVGKPFSNHTKQEKAMKHQSNVIDAWRVWQPSPMTKKKPQLEKLLKHGTEGRVNDMRLIDADALKDRFSLTGPVGVSVRRVIDKAPTIDAVPVVRCKDCKHWEEIKHGQGWCTGFAPSDVFSAFNDFCSYGERREGDGR